jgi:hypothetical protein
MFRNTVSITTVGTPILLTTLVLTVVLGPVRADNTGRTYSTIYLTDGNKKTSVTVSAVTDQDDRAAMERLSGGLGNPREPLRKKILDDEQEFYADTSFTPAPGGLKVNGFDIGANVPTARVNCAGLVFARLLGEPLILAPREAMKIVDTFGTPVEEKDVRPGDVLFWTDANGTGVQHFAIVQQVSYPRVPTARIPDRGAPIIQIATKDDKERVYLGLVAAFPVEKKVLAARPVYYRLEWDKIKVTRQPKDPEPGLVGMWRSPGNGTFTITLTGTTVTATMSGTGDEWWSPRRNKGGTATGTITGRTLTGTSRDGVGNVSTYTLTLSQDGTTLSGTFRVTAGPLAGANGPWSLSRVK